MKKSLIHLGQIGIIFIIGLIFSVILSHAFIGTVSDGIYNQTLYLPSTNGIPEDGTYRISMNFDNAIWGPLITVNGEASIYQVNTYESDLLADSFIKELDINYLLTKNKDYLDADEADTDNSGTDNAKNKAKLNAVSLYEKCNPSIVRVYVEEDDSWVGVGLGFFHRGWHDRHKLSYDRRC